MNQLFLVKRKLLFIIFPLYVVNTIQSQSKEINMEYLELYTTKQFKQIAEKFYTDVSVFEDPTMSFFTADKSHTISKGKKEIVDFLEKGFAKISNLQYEVKHSYTAGSINYNYGILHYNYAAAKKDGSTKNIKFSLPLAIILQIKDGKIIHHQDIADYNVWLEQYNKQIR